LSGKRRIFFDVDVTKPDASSCASCARHAGISEADARDMDQALRPTATTFVYNRQGTTMDMIFIHDSPIPLMFREHLHGRVFDFKPYDGLVEMGCGSEQ
jgi:hypothetical protein